MEQIDPKAAKKKITTGTTRPLMQWIGSRMPDTRYLIRAVTILCITGPQVAYTLKEADIMDDLYQIRKVGSGVVVLLCSCAWREN